MSNISRKIAKKYRYLFYGFLSLSVFSGSGFWLLRNFAMVEGDFGPESHFLQYPFLQLHGFAAFMMLMALRPKRFRYKTVLGSNRYHATVY